MVPPWAPSAVAEWRTESLGSGTQTGQMNCPSQLTLDLRFSLGVATGGRLAANGFSGLLGGGGDD